MLEERLAFILKLSDLIERLNTVLNNFKQQNKDLNVCDACDLGVQIIEQNFQKSYDLTYALKEKKSTKKFNLIAFLRNLLFWEMLSGTNRIVKKYPSDYDLED